MIRKSQEKALKNNNKILLNKFIICLTVSLVYISALELMAYGHNLLAALMIMPILMLSFNLHDYYLKHGN